MSEMTTVSKEKLAGLEARVHKLAADKSHLQLVIQLMNRMSAVAGLDNTVENILRAASDTFGGVNLILYYMIDDDVHCADVYGTRRKLGLESIRKPLCRIGCWRRQTG
jgi:hypothetical protein